MSLFLFAHWLFAGRRGETKHFHISSLMPFVVFFFFFLTESNNDGYGNNWGYFLSVQVSGAQAIAYLWLMGSPTLLNSQTRFHLFIYLLASTLTVKC